MAKRKQTASNKKGKAQNTSPLDKGLEMPTERDGSEATTGMPPETPKSLNYAGILIANEKRPAEKGTMGGVLMSDKGVLYGITCFHTVKHDNKNFAKLLPTESVKVVSEDNKEIGFFDEMTAFINNKVDIALIKLSGKFHNETIGSPTKFVEITEADKGTEVYFFNDRTKTKVKGFIRAVNQEVTDRLGTFENIIFVSTIVNTGKFKGKSISDEGDSGSWLLRVSDNALIGVLFANSAFNTQVMPITEIVKVFQIKKINLSLNLLPE